MIETDITFDFIYFKPKPLECKHVATLFSHGNEWNRFLQTIKLNYCEMTYPDGIISHVDTPLDDDELKILIRYLKYKRPYNWEKILPLCEICASEKYCFVKVTAEWEK